VGHFPFSQGSREKKKKEACKRTSFRVHVDPPLVHVFIFVEFSCFWFGLVLFCFLFAFSDYNMCMAWHVCHFGLFRLVLFWEGSRVCVAVWPGFLSCFAMRVGDLARVFVFLLFCEGFLSSAVEIFMKGRLYFLLKETCSKLRRNLLLF